MMGRKPQGKAMGMLTTAGSLGRIVFPLIAGANYEIASVLNVVVSGLSGLILVLSQRFIRVNHQNHQ
jgi:hypothetical protein